MQSSATTVGPLSFDSAGFIYRRHIAGTLHLGHMTAGRYDQLVCRWPDVTRVAFTSSADSPHLSLYVWGPQADVHGSQWSPRLGAHKLCPADELDHAGWTNVAAAFSRYSGRRVTLDLRTLPPKPPWWRRV